MAKKKRRKKPPPRQATGAEVKKAQEAVEKAKRKTPK